ncbi:hypothetical protein Hanom_Chr00s118546g01810691 [Helianthus anomalus]
MKYLISRENKPSQRLIKQHTSSNHTHHTPKRLYQRISCSNPINHHQHHQRFHVRKLGFFPDRKDLFNLRIRGHEKRGHKCETANRGPQY